jgi:hypothetical protein
MQDIRNMPNESNSSFGVRKQDFVDSLASILAPCNIPATAARLWGYLLLSAEPMSLDQISADLNMSKSSACTAAQLLERLRSAKRHTERGSNRVLYGPSDNYAGPLSEQSALMDALGKQLQDRGVKAASGPALKRMRTMAKFFFAMRDALNQVAAEFEVNK